MVRNLLVNTKKWLFVPSILYSNNNDSYKNKRLIRGGSRNCATTQITVGGYCDKDLHLWYGKVPGSHYKNNNNSNKNKSIIGNNSNNNNKEIDHNNNISNSRKPIFDNSSSSKILASLWDEFDDHFLFNFPDICKTSKLLLATKINILKALSITVKNTAISPDFLVWKFFGKAQFLHSSGESPETMRKLCLSAKFPHQEIRWN